jgi:Dolichyl-phosphate-mannose-protein mannosyltransferase
MMHAPESKQRGPLEASIFVEALRAHAGSFVAGALIAHAILWTLVPLISEPTPSPKIALGLATGREWMLGYPGLPPLAPWLMQAVYGVTHSIAVVTMLGPVMVAITGWLVFALARRVVGVRQGAIAALVMVAVHPVAFPVGALDSALIEMPLAAGAVLAWWRAVWEGNRRAWLLLGFTLGLLCYAGALGIFLLAALVGLTLASSTGRTTFRVHDSYGGAAMAFVVFVIVAAPRVAWLVTHGFSGLIEDVAAVEPIGLIPAYEAFGGAIAGHLGLIVLIIIASPLVGGGRAAATVVSRAPIFGFPFAAVLVLATLPFVLAGVAASVLGIRTTISAFAPLLLYSGLLAVVLAGDSLRIHRQRVVALVAILFLVLPPLLDALTGFIAPWVGNRGLPSNWPAAEVARAVTETFRARTGKRLEIVVADPVTASEVALASRDRPHVFPNGDPALAPWINEGDLRAKGAVVIWPIYRGNTAPPAALAANLPLFVPEAPLTLSWVRSGRLDPIRLGWAIIPPAP